MVTHLIELGLYKPSGLLIRHPLQDLKVHGPNLDTDKNYQLIKNLNLKVKTMVYLNLKRKYRLINEYRIFNPTDIH